MITTSVYSYFYIESNGSLGSEGLIANTNAIFCPHEITKLLDIEPFEYWKAGDLRIGGNGRYGFSSWAAEKCSDPTMDVEELVRKTISALGDKISLINQLKLKYDVCSGIMIVPSIVIRDIPAISFGRDIIEFCYLTSSDIAMDLYVSQD